MANAFPSIAHEELDKVVEQKSGEEGSNDQRVLTKRYREACTYVKTETGGALVGALGTGGMQGDSVMPNKFTAGYNEGIHKWVEETACSGQAGLEATEPLSQERVDLGISVYADDLWRIQVVRDMEEVRETVKRWDEKLDEKLGGMEMGQNHSKKEHMAKFVGRGAVGYMKEAYQGHQPYSGQVLATVRYLGAWLNNNGRNGVEVRKKKEAAQKGWRAMGSLWANGSIRQRTQAAVYRSLPQSCLLSGLEAACLTNTEITILETRPRIGTCVEVEEER